MAKSKGYSGILGSIGAFCAFFGVSIKGIFFILGLFGIVISVEPTFIMIADWMLLVSVAFVGWSYLRSHNMPGPDILWTVLYLVFVALAFAGTIEF